jgi:hypothetical protein
MMETKELTLRISKAIKASETAMANLNFKMETGQMDSSHSNSVEVEVIQAKYLNNSSVEWVEWDLK